MATEKRTSNFVPTLVGVSSVDGETPELLAVDPITNRLLVDAELSLEGVSLDGADGAIVDGANEEVRATVLDLTNGNPLTVAILDDSGDQITSFGGGTQYTEGDTDSSITGTALLFESNTGTNALSVVSNSAPLPVSDAGGALTVDGTITANLSAVDNAVLDDIAADTEAIKTAVEGTLTVSGTVDLGATDNGVLDNIDTDLTTIIGHVDGVEGLLTTIDADTGNMATSLATLDNIVAGSEAQVDVVGALPAGNNNIGDVDVASIAAGDNNIGNVDIASIAAGDNNIGNVDVVTLPALAAGTNAIGKLAANSGVDIGDVDVTSLPALAAGTNAVGKLLPPDIDVTAHSNYARKYYTSAGAATDGIIWSPAAGKRWHVTSLIFQVSADATVTFEDDKSGGDDPVLKGEFKAGSGLALTFDEKYPFASGEDAADLLITTSAGNVYVSVVGYEI